MGSMNAMMEQQAALAKLQNQIALGTRVTTPADDPIAAVHILELQRAQSESEQFAKNSTLAKNRLNLEEQSMVDVGNVLTRVRELMVQAGNTGTLSNNDRLSISTELAARPGDPGGVFRIVGVEHCDHRPRISEDRECQLGFIWQGNQPGSLPQLDERSPLKRLRSSLE